MEQGLALRRVAGYASHNLISATRTPQFLLVNFEDNPIAKAPRAEEFRGQGAKEKGQVKETLDLRRILGVRAWDVGDDGEGPPVPCKAVSNTEIKRHRVLEGPDEPRN